MMLPSSVTVCAISGSGATWDKATDKAVVEIKSRLIRTSFPCRAAKTVPRLAHKCAAFLVICDISALFRDGIGMRPPKPDRPSP
jgi:hypothetical protein